MRTLRLWPRLPRGAVVAPSQAVPKARLGGIWAAWAGGRVPATPCAPAGLPHVPPLLRTKQRHRVQSRRACIASGCGVSGETSSRQEKRTEGLKMIPVSRVTHCHANSPGANPIPGGRGDGARPTSTPACPQPRSPAACGSSPCSPPPHEKTSGAGRPPPTRTRGAEGGGTQARSVLRSGAAQLAWGP